MFYNNFLAAKYEVLLSTCEILLHLGSLFIFLRINMSIIYLNVNILIKHGVRIAYLIIYITLLICLPFV